MTVGVINIGGAFWMILNDFINKYVTKRNDSMFRIDIESHNE